MLQPSLYSDLRSIESFWSGLSCSCDSSPYPWNRSKMSTTSRTVSLSSTCRLMQSPRTDQASSSLYRRSLKLALDWSVHRYLWRGQAIYIRSLFEANKNIREPRQQRAGLKSSKIGIRADYLREGPISTSGGSAGEMEASRSIPCTDCTWRQVKGFLGLGGNMF